MTSPDSGAPLEWVQLLHDDGTPAGLMEKRAAHESPGHLHRAFSVLLFDEAGRLLLQRRAASKYHFAGKWSNACCSHPAETENLESIGRRRLAYELGVDAALTAVGSFRYVAIDGATGLVEREEDTVLVGYVASTVMLVPNDSEVWTTRFISIADLRDELRRSPDESTPWLPAALECAIRAGHPMAHSIVGAHGCQELRHV